MEILGDFHLFTHPRYIDLFLVSLGLCLTKLTLQQTFESRFPASIPDFIAK